MNIYDIAKLSGASIATVSRVINNDPAVKPQTRERILAVIEANHYSPTKGRNVSKRICIAMVYDSVNSPENQRLLRLCTLLSGVGYDPYIVCCINDNFEKRKLLNQVVESKPLAIILNGADFISNDPADNSYLNKIAAITSIIYLGYGIAGSNMYTISTDTEKTIYNLTRDIISQTQKLPVFLFSSMNDYHMNMVRGYRMACETFTKDIPSENIHLCDPRTEAAQDFVMSLINENVDFDTIITTDNRIAIRLFIFLSNKNITLYGYGSEKIPFHYINTRDEDICSCAINIIKALSSHNDIPNQTIITPTITKLL